MVKQFLKTIAKCILPYKKFNLVLPTKIYGRKIRIPIIRGFRAGFTEPWMLDLFGRILNRSQGTFLDIGVNLGQTLIKVKCKDPGRKYVGFEPNPVCCFYVEELIKENNFENCMIVPVGLMDKDGLQRLSFFANNTADSTATLIEDFRPNATIDHKTFVPVFRFDSISSEFDLDDIAFIKIDVEGAEVEVLESLRSEIIRHRPLILYEVLPIYISSNTIRRERQDKLETILRDMNYKQYRVLKTKGDMYCGLQEIETIGIHSDLACCDYVAIPEEIEESICTNESLGTILTLH